jgi:hypothetical protein
VTLDEVRSSAEFFEAHLLPDGSVTITHRDKTLVLRSCTGEELETLAFWLSAFPILTYPLKQTERKGEK